MQSESLTGLDRKWGFICHWSHDFYVNNTSLESRLHLARPFILDTSSDASVQMSYHYLLLCGSLSGTTIKLLLDLQYCLKSIPWQDPLCITQGHVGYHSGRSEGYTGSTSTRPVLMEFPLLLDVVCHRAPKGNCHPLAHPLAQRQNPAVWVKVQCVLVFYLHFHKVHFIY